jgi:ATP-dependent protease La
MTSIEATALLPVLPLRNSVLFPGLVMPLVAGRVRSVAAVEAALATEDKTLLVVAQKDPVTEEPALADLFHIGTRAVIKKMERTEQQVQIIVHGIDRVGLTAVRETTPFLKVAVRALPFPKDSGPEVEALQRTVLELAGKLARLVSPQAQAGLNPVITEVKEPLQQVYLLSSMLTLDLDKEQALLASGTRREALRLMHQYLLHELQVIELRQQIANQVQSEISREQREYHLRQQLRAIQEQLGEQNPEQAEIAELRKRLEEAHLPEDVHKEASRELARLERIPPASPEHQVIRSYLELITELPWSKLTEDILDMQRARTVLDEDHFDLEDVKERIIGHLAVLKLNPHAKAPILCFAGPPGVGKTSLGKSIARALARKFERLSLGGLHDEAELRGHRRTYIGAMTGRILQAIRRAGVKNPLLMLDEVDKLGRDFRGDPAAALLEILDPAQNYEFRDNYLDLPFDLSKVFFITTANTLDTIPQPLLDRMEVLRLPGYSDEEKCHIARRYLIPRQLKEAGLTEQQLEITEEALKRIIRRYTREAGVRQLERTLGSLCRKVATRFAEGNTEAVKVVPEALTELLGREHFFAEDARQQFVPGVAAGLAWTQVGGEVLYVEAVLLPESKELTLTGQLGDVMKESARAALSYISSRPADFGIEASALRAGAHIHVPAGATPKDGPSAGVTMAVALVSLYTAHAVKSDTAMTGEITLSGLVLPIGGVKEKVLAAHRAGIKCVILPKDNKQDLNELPEHIRGQLEFIFAERIEDVVAAVIPELAEHLRHD